MSFARLHEVVTYLIAGLGLAALSLGPDLGRVSEVILAVTFVLSLFARGELIRSRFWISAWNVGLLALLGLQVARGLAGAAILPLALQFAAALQISRLYNRRGAREHQQITALALLHLIAATVLSTALAYALIFVGFVVVAPWMLALSHLRSEIEAHLESLPEPERSRALARTLASERVVGPGFLFGTAALAIPLFAMTGLLFLAFPRVGLGFLSFGRGEGRHVTGFGANVELGDFGLIRSDPTVVMRVTPPHLASTPPETAAIRMRGTSFDYYDGRRWTRSRDFDVESIGRVGSQYAVPSRLPNPARDEPWRVVLDPIDEPVIFLPPNTVGVEISPTVSGGIEVGRHITLGPGTDIRYGDDDGLGLRYVAWTSDDPFDRDVEPLEPARRRRYLQLPGDHARVAQLARSWAGAAAGDAERVRLLLAHLRESGEYEYSLSMPEVGERSPLDVFLFEAKRGHCEYYSTALAVMLRTLGIPSRNVTGFLGGRYNPFGRYYALSQGDAHSWVEVWLEGRGWVVVDPTPPSRDAVAREAGWMAEIRQVVDALRTRWTEHVVGYDLRSQIRFFRKLRRWLGRGAGAAPRVPQDAEQHRSEPSDRTPGPAWLIVLAGLLAAGALLLWWVRRRRSAAPLGDEEARRAVALYRSLDSSLDDLGYPRPPSRTPEEHVTALAEGGFAEIDLVREVTDTYLAARYGGRPIDPEELARLSRAVRNLRKKTDLFAPVR